MPDITGAAQRHVRLDAFLSNSPFVDGDGFIDLQAAAKVEGAVGNTFLMNPTGILISTRATDATASTATVRGSLFADPVTLVNIFQLAVGIIHPLRFQRIKAEDAAGIFIVGN